MKFKIGDIIKSINYTKNGFIPGDIYYIRETFNGWYKGRLLKRDRGITSSVGRNNWGLEDLTIKDGDFEVIK